MPGSSPYCDRCGDAGLVSVDRIGVQPEALRCSCYQFNPVIQARHQRFKERAEKKGKRPRQGGGGMGPQSRFSLQRVVGRTECQIFKMGPGGGRMTPPPGCLGDGPRGLPAGLRVTAGRVPGWLT